MITHLFNGMSGVNHKDEPGLALLTLTDDRMTAGLITDLIHVNPQAVQLAFRAKGSKRVCLVSDSMSWCSPWAIAYGIFKSKGAVRLKDGGLTGSGTALSECVRNAVIHCGIKLEEALRAATVVPADLVGREKDCGRIKIGSCPDMIAWDADLKVIRTWLQ